MTCALVANAPLCPAMIVTIPDAAVQGILLSSDEARIELAAALYAAGRASMGRAKEIAGVTHLDMQRELHKRRIPLNYSLQDWQDDWQTVQELNARDRR